MGGKPQTIRRPGGFISPSQNDLSHMHRLGIKEDRRTQKPTLRKVIDSMSMTKNRKTAIQAARTLESDEPLAENIRKKMQNAVRPFGEME